MANTLRVEQIRSGIARPTRQRETLKALGLGKMHRVVTLPDNAQVRGMIKSIEHLVRLVPDGE